MLERLTETVNVPVIMEGEISRPEEVKRAMELWAWAVVVGTAITRPRIITRRFVKAIG